MRRSKHRGYYRADKVHQILIRLLREQTGHLALEIEVLRALVGETEKLLQAIGPSTKADELRKLISTYRQIQTDNHHEQARFTVDIPVEPAEQELLFKTVETIGEPTINPKLLGK